MVTTRFASVPSALDPDEGLVVDQSVDALAEGMRAFLRGEVPLPKDSVRDRWRWLRKRLSEVPEIDLDDLFHRMEVEAVKVSQSSDCKPGFE